jgi:hypothetical protein
MFLLRALTIVATILPNPFTDCIPEVHFYYKLFSSLQKLGNPWIEAFRILVGQLITCNDVLFSGHTVNLSLCALAWHQYSHLAPLGPPNAMLDCYCGIDQAQDVSLNGDFPHPSESKSHPLHD